MAATLSDKTIDLVKATVPALETHGLAITQRMYARMFQNPDIRDLFNQSHHGETGSQPKALAAAVIAYARNIDNLGALASRVERIAQKPRASSGSRFSRIVWCSNSSAVGSVRLRSRASPSSLEPSARRNSSTARAN